MSEQGGFGISFVERFFGLILMIVGALAGYYTFTSTEALRAFTGFFGLLSILVFALGLVLVTAKTE